ncbi:MAG: DUF2934 domain-containing protein [Candidatus Omnitrophota bacterium]
MKDNVNEIFEDEIRLRAYDRYEYRIEHDEPGTAEEDWLAAKKEVIWLNKPDSREHAKKFIKMFNIK